MADDRPDSESKVPVDAANTSSDSVESEEIKRGFETMSVAELTRELRDKLGSGEKAIISPGKKFDT